MRILLICPYFPPDGTIASRRIESFARYWARSGNEVIVLTRTALAGRERTLGSKVTVLRVRDPISRSENAALDQDSGGYLGRFRTCSKQALKRLLLVPDTFVLWAFKALSVYKGLEGNFDVVVSSGGPLSSIILGSRIAKRAKVPFVVDFRDPLLSRRRHYPYGRIRYRVDSRIEKSAVRTAALVTSVSEGVASELSEFHGVDVEVVANAFEPNDFQDVGEVQSAPASVLRITYCGNVYPDRSDLTPLFLAIAACQSREALAIEFHYYGGAGRTISEWARAAGVENLVTDHGPVSHEESIRAQMSADLLALLLWADPRDGGVVSGKLYEYIGAGRPIIQVGAVTGEASHILRENNLGVVSEDPRVLTDYLLEYMATKVRSGKILATSAHTQHLFTREFQANRMLKMLNEIVEVGA